MIHKNQQKLLKKKLLKTHIQKSLKLEERATEPEKKTDDLSIKLVSEISELSKL